MATTMKPQLQFPGLSVGATTGAAPAWPAVCPACGGLECLCRPRFFAGQLLTDEDLRRLDRYITAKSRLHNRHLHGSGVVCGLEVACDACESGAVKVRPGYALSPCGEDIVVCGEVRVPVCELIAACRTAQRVPDCDPPIAGTDESCREGTDQWVLAICYEETLSRQAPALRSSSGGGGSCGCSCGGTGTHCRCGGTAQGSRTTTAAATPAGQRAGLSCEPTVVCEGYRFKVYPKPRPATPLPNDPWGELAALAEAMGPMMQRVFQCWMHLVKVRAVFHGQEHATDLALQTAYADYLAAVRAFAAEHATHNCEILRVLDGMDLKQAATVDHWIGLRELRPGFDTLPRDTVAEKVEQLDRIATVLWRECLCSTLLPPCPDPAASDCVPIALLTVQRGDCRVREVCNFAAREFAITLPNLQYWLGFLQLGRIKDDLAGMCCKPVDGNSDLAALGQVLGKVGVMTRREAAKVHAAPATPATAPPGAATLAEAATRFDPGFNPRDTKLGPLFAMAYRAMFPGAMNDWLLQLAGAPDKDTPTAPGGLELKALHERVTMLEQRLAPAAPPPPATAPAPARKRRK